MFKALWKLFKAEPEVQVFRNPERLAEVSRVVRQEPLVNPPLDAYQSPPPLAHVGKNDNGVDGALPDTKLLDALNLIERRAPLASVRHVLDALKAGEITAWARPMKLGPQYLVKVPACVWQDHVYEFIFAGDYYGSYESEVKRSGEKAYSRIIAPRGVNQYRPFGYEAVYYDVYLSTQEIDKAFPARLDHSYAEIRDKA